MVVTTKRAVSTDPTVEEIIILADKAGWRFQNLSHLAGPDKWQCIFESKKPGKDGFRVYAGSDLTDQPHQAIRQAWFVAQSPVMHTAVPLLDKKKPATFLKVAWETDPDFVRVANDPTTDNLMGRLDWALEWLAETVEGENPPDDYL